MLPVLVFLLLTSPLAAQSTVDTTGAGALISQAMDHSEVMANLGHLTDIMGPRLSGSPPIRKANDWTLARFQAYGLDAALEPYRSGVTWQRGTAMMRIRAPFERGITAHSWAWTAGTGGKPLAGRVIVTDLTTPDSLAAYRGRVKGAWVLPRASFPLWNPDGPPMTGADSTRLQEAMRLRQQPTADTSAAAVWARRQFALDLPYALKAAGALGTLVDGAKEHALMTMSGSPNRVSPLPNLVISHEDYTLLERLARSGVTPRIVATVENTLGKAPVDQWNTVAEIKGTDRPGQVVILGAHLDSWDLGTGTTDNGTGAMAVLETARVIAQSGVKPKRTIRSFSLVGKRRACWDPVRTLRPMLQRETAFRRCSCSTTGPARSPGRRCREGMTSSTCGPCCSPRSRPSARTASGPPSRWGPITSRFYRTVSRGSTSIRLRGATTTRIIRRATRSTRRSRGI